MITLTKFDALEQYWNTNFMSNLLGIPYFPHHLTIFFQQVVYVIIQIGAAD